MSKTVKKMSLSSDLQPEKGARRPAVFGMSAAGVVILKPIGKPSFSVAKLKKAIEEANRALAASD